MKFVAMLERGVALVALTIMIDPTTKGILIIRNGRVVGSVTNSLP